MDASLYAVLRISDLSFHIAALYSLYLLCCWDKILFILQADHTIALRYNMRLVSLSVTHDIREPHLKNEQSLCDVVLQEKEECRGNCVTCECGWVAGCVEVGE